MLNVCTDKTPLKHRRSAMLVLFSPVNKATKRLSAAAFNTPLEGPAAPAPNRATRQGHRHQQKGDQHLSIAIPNIPAIAEAENALTIGPIKAFNPGEVQGGKEIRHKYVKCQVFFPGL